MKLLPYVRMFFMAADADAGGGTAVTEAPAAPATPSPAASELDSFQPPSLDFLEQGKGDAPKPEPKAEPPKQEPKKEEPKKPEPAKPGAKTNEPPAKQLRDELDRTKGELKTLQERFEKHPRVSELEAAVAEKEKEVADARKRVEDAEKRLAVADPLAQKRVVEHLEKFNSEYARSVEAVPELEPAYMDLVREFAALPRQDRTAYGEALKAFEEKISELVGERKFGTAMELVRKGFDFSRDHAKLREEVQTDAQKFAFEEREKSWREYDGTVSAHIKSALEVPEGLETSDPHSPLLFISNGLKEMDESKRTALQGKVETFVRRLFAGEKPRTAKDFPGLSEDQVRERLAQEQKWHSQAREMGAKTLTQALYMMAMFRPMLADYSKLRERLSEESRAIPPDPNSPTGDGAISSGDALERIAQQARAGLDQL